MTVREEHIGWPSQSMAGTYCGEIGEYIELSSRQSPTQRYSTNKGGRSNISSTSLRAPGASVRYVYSTSSFNCHDLADICAHHRQGRSHARTFFFGVGVFTIITMTKNSIRRYVSGLFKGISTTPKLTNQIVDYFLNNTSLLP